MCKNRLVIKDVSGFEPYEDWWEYEVQVHSLIHNDVEIDLNTSGYLRDVLHSVVDTLKFSYSEEEYYEYQDFEECEKYLLDVLNREGFTVEFEAHDDLIMYETYGITSSINPEFKIFSTYCDFQYAEDTQTDIHPMFEGVEFTDILHAIKNKNTQTAADKVLNNIITRYSSTLSFHKMLLDKLKSQEYT